MNTRLHAKQGLIRLLATLAMALPLAASAQTPVDENGNAIGKWEHSPAAVEPVVGNEDIPLLSSTELQDLVGPIALYPDDLLAIVLPASAYPLQIVDAARFLEELEQDPSLEPDPEWDDSVVALLNYPEILEHLNEDIDWTWRLGEAVIAQQTDVVSAIESFRDRAYAAGNLKSDPYQNVTRDNGVIEITPVSEDVIYVPYYEPERVVVYQPRPVYYYYPRPYPVYYYPYASSYHFDRGFFWGVTTAFTIGWFTDSLHVYHHSYHGHPYYGRSYWDRWWYRRPSINVYNTTYVDDRVVTVNRYYRGDRWQPRTDRRRYVRDERVTINRNYHTRLGVRRQEPRAVRRHEPRAVTRQEPRTVTRQEPRSVTRQEPIRFRDRSNDSRDPQRRVRPAERRDVAAKKQTGTVRHIRPEQRELTARLRQERREPAVRQRQEQREPAVRQRQERSEPTVRQRAQRTRPTATPRQERHEPAVRRAPQKSREPVRHVRPQRSEPQRQAVRRESRPTPQSRPAPKRSESSRSEARERSEKRRDRDARR